jgi:hydroxypyruvate reductase
VGKAASAMYDAALAARDFDRAIVIVPPGIARPRTRSGLTVRIAPHPIPSSASVEAGELVLDEVGRARRTTLLLSGGASAMLSAPTVPLADKAAVTRALLASHATIADLNTVRRHLSRIKGGHLAVRGAVDALVFSDVGRGGIWDIASGPSVGDPTTARDARAILARHVPAFAKLPLSRSISPSDPRLSASRARVLAGPRSFAAHLAQELERRGLRTIVRPFAGGEVTPLARAILRAAANLPPRTAIVRPAEPVLAVPARAGRGGRSTHLAALVGAHLPPGVAFLAGATDGVDGASGTGGAAVERSDLPDVAHVAAFVRALDTGTLHLLRGTALPGNPTGLNFADVHVLVRA